MFSDDYSLGILLLNWFIFELILRATNEKITSTKNSVDGFWLLVNCIYRITDLTNRFNSMGSAIKVC